MLKVCKFGGSSLANAEEFKKVKAILLSDPSRRYVVVSAPGKSEAKDNKVTDLLYLTYQHLKYHVDYHEIFDSIKKRYLKIEKDLQIPSALEKEFALIEVEAQ
jgi:aspartate kinase